MYRHSEALNSNDGGKQQSRDLISMLCFFDPPEQQFHYCIKQGAGLDIFSGCMDV